MALALLGICVLVSLAAAVKPHTKEKFAFAGVTALLAVIVIGGGGESLDKVQKELSTHKERAAGADAGFGRQLETGGGKPIQVTASASVGETASERVGRLTVTDYQPESGTKSLYRRVVRILPLGRIKVLAPETPGITVLTGYSRPGPSLGSIPTRVPLGVLDPQPGQRPPMIGNQ